MNCYKCRHEEHFWENCFSKADTDNIFLPKPFFKRGHDDSMPRKAFGFKGRNSSAGLIPSGKTFFISLSARARLLRTPLSCRLIHFRSAPVEMWFTSQKPYALIWEVLLYCQIGNSFLIGFGCSDIKTSTFPAKYRGLQFFFCGKLKPAAEAKPLLPVSWPLFAPPKQRRYSTHALSPLRRNGRSSALWDLSP